MGDSGISSEGFGVGRNLFLVPLSALTAFADMPSGDGIGSIDLSILFTGVNLEGTPSVKDDVSLSFVMCCMMEDAGIFSNGFGVGVGRDLFKVPLPKSVLDGFTKPSSGNAFRDDDLPDLFGEADLESTPSARNNFSWDFVLRMMG